MTRLLRTLCVLAAGLLLGTLRTGGADSGSAMSYQGRLSSGGAPANGLFDFRFTLWDAATNGVAISGPIVKDAAPVANGVFSVTLDFGATAFDGNARWLEIAVRPAGNSDPHTTLVPRQKAGALPYAIHALDSPRTSDLTSLSNNFAAQINSLSNSLRSNIPTGVTVASIDPADTSLLNNGLTRAFTIAAPAWANGSTANQPAARFEHSTIWTGHELIVWGGKASASTLLGTGGRYKPDADQWTSVSTIAAPSARSGHTAIWTGDEMIIWAGFGAAGFLDTGARFQPTTQRWIPTATGPAERTGHNAVWTDSRMIVFGGRNANGLLNDGAFYAPTNNTWSNLTLPNAPAPRHSASATWTGSQLIVWGGEGDSGALNSGAKLLFDETGNPIAWQPISAINAPSPRSGHSAVWTGSRLLVWGGATRDTLLGDGAAYDPVSDTWSPLPITNSPSARSTHFAVWSGAEMIIWSGLGASGSLANGAAYDPIANTWRTLQNPGSPLARGHAGGIWTGSELLVFGGLSNGVPLANLQRLNPQPAWHLYRKL